MSNRFRIIPAFIIVGCTESLGYDTFQSSDLTRQDPTVPQHSERIVIMQTAPIRSLEYKNAFLYVVIRVEPGAGPGSYTFYRGINTRWFCRLAWNKAGICSNPAVRGIRLLGLSCLASTWRNLQATSFGLPCALSPVNKYRRVSQLETCFCLPPISLPPH